jgi:hypothetical protein
MSIFFSIGNGPVQFGDIAYMLVCLVFRPNAGAIETKLHIMISPIVICTVTCLTR